MTWRKSCLTVVCATMLCSSGCLLGVSGTTVTHGEVPRTVTDEIVYGQTTREWVIERLGQPDSCCQRDDGSEVLTYNYTKEEKASFNVLFLIGFSARNERVHTVDVELRDGIVHDVRRRSA